MNVTNQFSDSQPEEHIEARSTERAEASEAPGAIGQAKPSPEPSEANAQVERGESIPEATEVSTQEEAGERQAEVLVGEEQPEHSGANETGSTGELITESSATEQDNLDHVQPDLLNIIGQLIVEPERKTIATDRLPLVAVKPEEWKKVKAVFVPSPDYDEKLRSGFGTHEQRHVFIAYGPERAGKFACAVHLGLDLLGEGQTSQPKFSVYNRTVRDTRMLIDFAQEPELAEDTVYIIEDAFENGVRLEELSAPYLAAINASLENRRAYLILTTTYEAGQLDALQVGKVSAVVEDMHTVLENHLDRYGSYVEKVYVPAELVELAREEHEKLEAEFRWPFQVDIFCYKLSQLTSEAKEEDLLELAEWVGRIGQEPARRWFDSLSSENAKLYAMLVVLFDGLDRLMLDEIYGTAVQILRDGGVSSLRDPREIGLDNILEELQTQETGARLVRFNSLAFEREVRRQIVNHHLLLWSFIDLPLDLIEEFKAPHHWELRRNLGAAIGRLGIYHQHKLKHVLVTLARHEHGGVVAVAGYALDEICRAGPEYYTFVTELLDSWVTSGDPDLMWAAGAAIWRIYDGLAKVARGNGGESQEAQQAAETLNRVRELLTELAKTCDLFSKEVRNKARERARQLAQVESTTAEWFFERAAQLMREQLEAWAADNVRSIMHAIRQIALTHPKGVVELITHWLKAEQDSYLRILGQMAGRQLLVENSDPEIRLLEDRHRPLLDLVSPLLSTDAEIVDVVIRTLLVWLQRPAWANRVQSVLLCGVNRARGEDASILRASLSHHWLDSDSTDAHRIGQSLIARSYSMNGVPMVMPGHHYGVIALDASHEARMNQVCARAVRKLYERLDPQVDMYVLRMGEMQTLAKSGQSVSTIDLQADHDMARLLMPLLEGLDPSRAYFALALAWGPIIDLDDACAGSWSDRLIVAVAKEQDEWPEKLTTVPVDRLMSERSLIAIEGTVREQLAQTLVALEPEEWWSTLCEYVQVEPTDVDAIVAKLNAWVEQLDDIKHSKHPGDIARIITCVILWLAAWKLPRCVEVIRTWLTNEDELSRLMGVACGKTLFRVYAQCDPAPPVQSHAILLELAPLLAKQGWSGAEAVLYAARRWAVQPEWSDRLVTCPNGNPSELMQLVDAVPPESRDALADALKDWLAPEDGETAPEPVVKLAERLQLHMALGAREPLPHLPEGYTYGLIVVDASSRDNRRRSRLAKLASSLIKRLNKRNQETLRLLIYRLGQDYPVAGPGQEPDAEVLVPPDMGCRPRLLGPLLEIHSMEQVGFVLLLTNGSILDQDDWSDTLWSERISVYSEVDDGYPQPFALIRKQFDEEAESAILRHLNEERSISQWPA